MPAVKNEDLPLDERLGTHHNPVTGASQSIPMLDSKWIEQDNVEFISYVPPPVKINVLQQSVCTNVNEVPSWEERSKFIINDLKWLLCQSHSQFWNQVIFNKSINSCLDSFLKLSPRSFDVWKLLPEEILSLQKQMHRSIFMVYLRMSTHKESKKDFFTPTIFGEILYENFLFDIPKVMDLCSLYGGEEGGNVTLLTKMLENVFDKQPKYIDDLHEMIPSIFEIFKSIEEEFGETSSTTGLATGEPANNPSRGGSNKGNTDDMIIYLFDICKTLQSLFYTLPKLCHHFLKVGFVQSVAVFWEDVLPAVARKYRGPEGKTAKQFLKKCKIDLVKICHLILNAACLGQLIDCYQEVDEESKGGYIEDFLSITSELLSFKRFLAVYYSYHDIKQDMDIIRHCGFCVDETRLQYIISAVDNELNEQKRRAKSRSDPKKDATASTSEEATMASDQNHSEDVRRSVSDTELHSMVSHVRDLLPDCSEASIITCLQKVNYDVEETINLILEHGPPLAEPQNDLNLSKAAADSAKPEGALSTRHSIFDNDEFDVFTQGQVDLARVQKGKSRQTENVNTVLDDKSDITNMKEFVLNYDEQFNDYEDEYDDTYDTQDVGARDVVTADELRELTTRRAFTTPVVLRNIDGNSDDEDKSSDGQEATSSAAGPQSHHHGNRRNGGKSEGPKRNYESGKNMLRDRAFKDKNKSKMANHNRKAAAAKKQSRGMPF